MAGHCAGNSGPWGREEPRDRDPGKAPPALPPPLFPHDWRSKLCPLEAERAGKAGRKAKSRKQPAPSRQTDRVLGRTGVQPKQMGRHSGIGVPEILFLLREEPRFGLTWLSAAVLAVLSFWPSTVQFSERTDCEHLPLLFTTSDRSFHAAGDSDFHLTHSALRLPDHSSLHPRAATPTWRQAPGSCCLLPGSLSAPAFPSR